ncbi:MAG: hypothetical protein Tsb009_03460 [Planctomycetaceae bacterium]
MNDSASLDLGQRQSLIMYRGGQMHKITGCLGSLLMLGAVAFVCWILFDKKMQQAFQKDGEPLWQTVAWGIGFVLLGGFVLWHGVLRTMTSHIEVLTHGLDIQHHDSKPKHARFRYEDIHAFAFSKTEKYSSGAYTGLLYELTFLLRDGTRITWNSLDNKNQDDLDQLCEKISVLVAEKYLDAWQHQGEVELKGVADQPGESPLLTKETLHIPKPLSQDGSPVTVPLNEIQTFGICNRDFNYGVVSGTHELIYVTSDQLEGETFVTNGKNKSVYFLLKAILAPDN